ncbi:tRNA pseudouridine(38-40) synthase TruA [Halosegnis rubeus]|jgi:tRNA pseudouridine38-40 synthase|uniref:tRNA pseudouridine synthase A n=1 Tax=Halosegnis rubeus TaxID=2212850 RepID=A0A5N5UL71_9EURY|nr:tRNA pseudouridine(38-40) synthase TruA [Halosegnis rubeus]KAB7519510.1 tRNA pseudouridine(38-40) synthase TruA [Halosegnis rubeus]
MRRAFRVAYDGTAYRGFQRQPHAETVENDLFRALAALGVTPDPQVPPDGYAAAGRTDAGVSARAQTVSLDCPEWLSPVALNSELPADVRAWASADVAETFHAQYDARSRRYRYFLHAPDADDSRVQDALDRLAGSHDFHNLTPDETGTERDLRTGFERDGEFLVCTFEAGGFPRSFVRRAVRLVEWVASGERDSEFVGRVLGFEPVTGADSFGAAPPEPLVLDSVAYPVRFERDEQAVASLASVFGRRRVERQTGARVADRLTRTD